MIFESKWMDYGFFDCLEFGKNWQEKVVTKLLELIEVGKNRQESELIADSWHDFSIRPVTFQFLSWFSYFLVLKGVDL